MSRPSWCCIGLVNSCILCVIYQLYMAINVPVMVKMYDRLPWFNSDQTPGGANSCHTRNSTFYLKVHKTGSTTISTILYSRAWRLGLSIIPVVEKIYPDNYIRKHLITLSNHTQLTLPVDVFAEHAIFNQTEARHIMKKDAFYVASLRHPFSQFKSTFHYFDFPKLLEINSTDPVKDFLQNINYYSPKLTKIDFNKLSNGMTQIFGIDTCKNYSISDIKLLIANLERQFDMVVMMEYFDESLVLLKRMACYNLKDIIYLPHRQSKYHYKNNEYNMKIRNAHRRISPADYELYAYFLNVFKLKVKMQQNDFWNELYHFKKINGMAASYCGRIMDRVMESTQKFDDLISDKDYLYIPNKPFGEDIVLQAVDCAKMKFYPYIIRGISLIKQFPDLCQLTSPNIIRYAGETVQSILQSRGVFYIHDAFCSEWNHKYDLPVDILSIRDSYS